MINRCPPLAFLLTLTFGVPVAAPAQVVPGYPQTETTTQREQPASKTEDTVTPGKISANPDKYIGTTVQIRSAEVETVHAQQLFTLDEDRLMAGPDVAVLIPKMVARAKITEDAKVDVKGTVRKFVATEIKRDYAGISLSPKVQSDLEGRPVVIAESVKTTQDGRELVSGATTRETDKEPARSEQPDQQGAPPPQPEP